MRDGSNKRVIVAGGVLCLVAVALFALVSASQNNPHDGGISASLPEHSTGTGLGLGQINASDAAIDGNRRIAVPKTVSRDTANSTEAGAKTSVSSSSRQTGPDSGAAAPPEGSDLNSEGRRARTAAIGLPGDGSRADPSRSYRSFASPEGSSVTLIQGLPDITAEAGQDESGTPADTDDSGQPEPIVTPLDVVQIARQWEDGVLQVSFAVMLDDDSETATPNGLIVSQQIPDGWEVVEAVPVIEAMDSENRIVKWLFVGDAVQDGSIYSLSMRAPAEQDGNWNETLAWYTYRQPDGQCVDVTVIPYPDSNIQPDE